MIIANSMAVHARTFSPGDFPAYEISMDHSSNHFRRREMNILTTPHDPFRPTCHSNKGRTILHYMAALHLPLQYFIEPCKAFLVSLQQLSIKNTHVSPRHLWWGRRGYVQEAKVGLANTVFRLSNT